MKQNYEEPQVLIEQVLIEKGFATSFTGSGIDGSGRLFSAADSCTLVISAAVLFKYFQHLIGYNRLTSFYAWVLLIELLHIASELGGIHAEHGNRLQ